MKKSVFGSMVATAVAGLFTAGISLADSHGGEHHEGADAAKGADAKGAYCAPGCANKSDCHGHGNATCAQKNKKKGEGWVKAKDAKECTAKGGTWKAG